MKYIHWENILGFIRECMRTHWNMMPVIIGEIFQVRKQLSEIVAILRGAVLEKPLQTIISG